MEFFTDLIGIWQIGDVVSAWPVWNSVIDRWWPCYWPTRCTWLPREPIIFSITNSIINSITCTTRAARPCRRVRCHQPTVNRPVHRRPIRRRAPTCCGPTGRWLKSSATRRRHLRCSEVNWCAQVARVSSARHCPPTGGPTRRCRPHSASCASAASRTALWSASAPATTRTGAPSCATPPLSSRITWPNSTIWGSSAGPVEVSPLSICFTIQSPPLHSNKNSNAALWMFHSK